ncbi:MAG: arsenosugar biosynthesis radical SAM (seleno)protein ArsS [Desulfobacteraceae bacterium]|nr:arsenosugar biosynthesis radical SAM (seleno)protein ArsS [Desulfobacteraceae bacterium]
MSSEFIDKKQNAAANVVPFKATLEQHNLKLTRNITHTLQVNLGFLCNQVCRHCHLEAGPGRMENMDAETVDAVIAYAARSNFETIDITGGAPELNSHLPRLIEDISPYAARLMLRSNLSAMTGKLPDLVDLLQRHRVTIVASFPSVNMAQSDSQRGEGIFQESVAVLKQLNKIGYGAAESNLVLDLVSNPTGAYLPPTQEQATKRFHQVLESKWGVVFNNLYNFANVPLGRFRGWLIRSNNFENYLAKLSSSFNPCAVEGLMCRSLVSVGWDGHLYDCDFNLARGLPMGGHKIHVSEMEAPPNPGSPIATADHCYTCTAGSGFT